MLRHRCILFYYGLVTRSLNFKYRLIADSLQKYLCVKVYTHFITRVLTRGERQGKFQYRRVTR